MISVEKFDTHVLVDIGFEFLINYIVVAHWLFVDFEMDVKIVIDYFINTEIKSCYINLSISTVFDRLKPTRYISSWILYRAFDCSFKWS